MFRKTAHNTATNLGIWSFAKTDCRNSGLQLPRREFLKAGLLSVSLTASAPNALATLDRLTDSSEKVLKVALLTDLHYADKPAAGTRHYRDTLSKLNEAKTQFKRDSVDLLIELGDLIDAADDPATEKSWLKTINDQLRTICEDRHYVLGNHCVDTLTKEEFLNEVQKTESWYSFDRQGWHFVVLDACFRKDGTPYGRRNFEWTDSNIPVEEIDWLKQDLQANKNPTIVVVHQRLDDPGNHGVRNQTDVRSVLESSGQIVAVFQGHSHSNDLKMINGIPYCTLVAMVEGVAPENSGYSTLELHPNGAAVLHGFRKQRSHEWQLNNPL